MVTLSPKKDTLKVSNVMLVKKSYRKWRMCVYYTKLNRAYSKDSYSFPNIDELVENYIGYKILSFLDAYFGYNQILMYEWDRVK